MLAYYKQMFPYLEQGSPICGLWAITGLWPAGHQATEQAGQCAHARAHTPLLVLVPQPWGAKMGCHAAGCKNRTLQCLGASNQNATTPQGMKMGCRRAAGHKNGTLPPHRT